MRHDVRVTSELLIATISAGIAGFAVALQIGDIRGQRRAERHSDCERIRRLSAEYLSSVADVQGAAAGQRQAWDSLWPKAVTLLHVAAAVLGQRDLLRGMGAAAPIAYAFFTGGSHGATMLSAPVARMGTAWMQVRQADDADLVAAADALYEVASETAAKPSSGGRERLEVAMKAFSDDARRAAHEARLPPWRRCLGRRLLRMGRRR